MPLFGRSASNETRGPANWDVFAQYFFLFLGAFYRLFGQVSINVVSSCCASPVCVQICRDFAGKDSRLPSPSPPIIWAGVQRLGAVLISGPPHLLRLRPAAAPHAELIHPPSAPERCRLIDKEGLSKGSSRYSPGHVRWLVRHPPGLSRRLLSPLRAGERSTIYPVHRHLLVEGFSFFFLFFQGGVDLHKGSGICMLLRVHLHGGSSTARWRKRTGDAGFYCGGITVNIL